jgi:hypothetical protein
MLFLTLEGRDKRSKIGAILWLCFFWLLIWATELLSDGKIISSFYRSPVFQRCYHTLELLLCKCWCFSATKLRNYPWQAQLCTVLYSHCRAHGQAHSSRFLIIGCASFVVHFQSPISVWGHPFLPAMCVCSVPRLGSVVCLGFLVNGTLFQEAISVDWVSRSYHSPPLTPYLNCALARSLSQ